MRVAVGLSGGVDSAVAAALLKAAGHSVTAVTMKTWGGRALPTASARHACYGPCEAEDIEDAARVARALDIPLRVVDLVDEYEGQILDRCRSQYHLGMTPNPCVHCNRAIKFELIPARLRETGVAFDRFATGHYAIVDYDLVHSRYRLRMGKDKAKDQSYFLCLITQEQLAGTLFPLGEYTKADVRQLAMDWSLPVAHRPESQDFVSGGYRGLFGDLRGPGPILDSAGKVLGQHDGIHLYTIGQRRGLGIAYREPLYVIAIDAKAAAIVVGTADELCTEELTASDVNWISIESLTSPARLSARIRQQHMADDVVVTPLGGGRLHVKFAQPQRAVAPGQAVAFYDGDVLLVGGLIERQGSKKRAVPIALNDSEHPSTPGHSRSSG